MGDTWHDYLATLWEEDYSMPKVPGCPTIFGSILQYASQHAFLFFDWAAKRAQTNDSSMYVLQLVDNSTYFLRAAALCTKSKK